MKHILDKNEKTRLSLRQGPNWASFSVRLPAAFDGQNASWRSAPEILGLSESRRGRRGSAPTCTASPHSVRGFTPTHAAAAPDSPSGFTRKIYPLSVSPSVHFCSWFPWEEKWPQSCCCAAAICARCSWKFALSDNQKLRLRCLEHRCKLKKWVLVSPSPIS